MKINKPVVLERNWGQETIVVWTPTHAGKLLIRKKGTKGGFQLHIKEESHYLHSGTMKLEVLKDGHVEEHIVEAGSSWTVEPLTVHREEALEDCLVFEVSDPTKDDRYGIVPDPGALPSMNDDQARQIAYDLQSELSMRAYELRSLMARIKVLGLAELAGKIPETVK